MPTPQQLPHPSQDASFIEDAQIYTDHALLSLKATDIRRAIEAAWLRGADAGFRAGYKIGYRRLYGDIR